MPLAAIREQVIPQLIAARVDRVTLTGGEPFLHPDIIEVVRAFRRARMSVGVCTNATLTTDKQIAALVAIGEVHMNVSLDGFAADSHGKFRGDRQSFHTTVDTVKRFGDVGTRAPVHTEQPRRGPRVRRAVRVRPGQRREVRADEPPRSHGAWRESSEETAPPGRAHAAHP
ncbi:radical SAM protein [Streptomyces sp. NPDC051567]|uniref:radical SAM protein n=1 Tax=Streptomyces sp. NPDC051567 TaxID=3365660 RepID=UPI00379C8FCF